MGRALLALALCIVVADAGAQTLVEHYTAAMQARGDEDFATYRSEMEAALALEPGHAILQFHLARACANTGEAGRAVDWLTSAFRQGAWIDPAQDPWLEPLHDHPGWPEVVQLAARTASHSGPGTVGLELEEFDLVPEGIEHDPVSDRFFLGSAKRKIVAVGRDGSSRDFVAPRQDGLLFPLGLRVDPERRRLWAVSVGAIATGNLDEDEAGTTLVQCWSLESGALLGTWSPPADTLQHGFNDLALHPDGSVVVTDADGGALYAVAIGDERMRTVLPPLSLRGPNGIALDEDGSHAWVSEYVYGVTRIDLRDGSRTRVEVPEHISMIGIDGLYRHGDELVAIQNYAGLDRAAMFGLDDGGTRVVSLRVLEARHPRMDDPTTGVIVDGELWYIANSHIAGLDAAAPPTREAWGTVLVLRVPL